MMTPEQYALKVAIELVNAEEAMKPHQEQIDAFMQDMDSPMNDEAQEAFDDWAMCLNETCKAFRHAGILYQREWTGAQYVQAAVLKIPVSSI